MLVFGGISEYSRDFIPLDTYKSIPAPTHISCSAKGPLSKEDDKQSRLGYVPDDDAQLVFAVSARKSCENYHIHA